MQTFRKAIRNVNNLISSTSFKERFRSNPKDFTRNRFLTFEITILTILDLTKKSLQIGLNSLAIQFNFYAVSKQAFSLARQKISFLAFKALNEEVVRTFYDQKKIKFYKKKYLLLAVDGSTLYLPNNKELSDCFSKAQTINSESVIARTSILYDVLNKITLDIQMVSYKSSEKVMILDHLKWLVEFQTKINKRIILLLDRGYPCVGLFLLLKDLGIDFICCAHSTKSKKITDQLEKNKQDGKVIGCADTTDKRRTARTWLGIEKGVQIDNWKCNLRAVRIGNKILISSLTDFKEFKTKEIQKAYKKRWEVETAYRTIKVDMIIENFSGKKKLVILQEIYVTILIQNLARIFEMDLESNKKGYFVNHREVLGILKVSLQIMLKEEEKIESIRQNLKINREKKVDNRKYPRKINAKIAQNRSKRLCYA